METWHATEFPKAKSTASEALVGISSVLPWKASALDDLCQCSSTSVTKEKCVAPAHLSTITLDNAAADLFSSFLLEEQKGKTVMAPADLGSPDCSSSQVPCWGQSCQELWVEIHSGTDPDRETAHV